MVTVQNRGTLGNSWRNPQSGITPGLPKQPQEWDAASPGGPGRAQSCVSSKVVKLCLENSFKDAEWSTVLRDLSPTDIYFSWNCSREMRQVATGLSETQKCGSWFVANSQRERRDKSLVEMMAVGTSKLQSFLSPPKPHILCVPLLQIVRHPCKRRKASSVKGSSKS